MIHLVTEQTQASQYLRSCCSGAMFKHIHENTWHSSINTPESNECHPTVDIG